MLAIKKIPKEKPLDSTLDFLQDGYCFISNRMLAHDTNIFTARFLGKKIVFLMGQEAVELFYNEEFFKRKKVTPKRVQKTLFGKKAIQGLDGAQHKKRKALFMSLLTKEYQRTLVDLCYKNLDRYAKSWEGKESIILYKESQKVLFESVCQWVGLPYKKDQVEELAEDFGLMVYGFGRIGKTYRKGKCARKCVEKWVKQCIIAVRKGTLSADKSSALYQMSMYEEKGGKKLRAQIAAVELINIIRPIIAIATYIAFEGVAIATYPESAVPLKNDSNKKMLNTDDVEESSNHQISYLEMFCQEIRRYYPFGPFIAAKVKKDFVWKEYYLKKNSLVVLDLYGTNHDPKLFVEPNQFKPERFLNRPFNPYDFIPQGGGSMQDGHRCAGDIITVNIMEVFADYLVNHIEYSIPKQNMKFSIQRFPTLPNSGFVMSDVKRLI